MYSNQSDQFSTKCDKLIQDAQIFGIKSQATNCAELDTTVLEALQAFGNNAMNAHHLPISDHKLYDIFIKLEEQKKFFFPFGFLKF